MASDLKQLLIDLAEYMHDRADADHDGISFVGNEEMMLELRIEQELAALTEEAK